MKWPNGIVLIGAGNVAWHLGLHLYKCGYEILHVHSHTTKSAEALAQELNCTGSSDPGLFPTQAELYLVIVPDGEIENVAATLQKYIAPDSLVMHTSGATPVEVLAPYFPRYGAFYPLQTFSKGRKIDFMEVPLCLHTALSEDYPKVKKLARSLVKNVHAVNDQQRAQLHLAAIFVNNFTNYLQFISREITNKHELPADLLQPLLRETIAKLEVLHPAQAQTGPAIRKDEVTMNRHLKMLKEHPEWAEIYRLLSEGIKRDLG